MADPSALPLIVVGLGNPTTKYERTRHNVGFRVLDALSPLAVWDERFSAFVCETTTTAIGVGSERERAVWLLKPQTYMNASGRSVQALLSCFNWSPSQLVVVHDELDVPLGQVRLKWGGGEAGHNGLRSLSHELNTQDYCRLRVGIGRPDKEFVGQIADYVLRAFPPAEEALLGDLIQKASAAIRLVLKVGFSDVGLDRVGFNQASNEINRR
jgi:peptidyl-tRNA hydrolase, PTH1 family